MRFFKDRSGAGILEYGLILGLVAMLAIGALLLLSNGSSSSLRNSAASFPSGAPDNVMGPR